MNMKALRITLALLVSLVVASAFAATPKVGPSSDGLKLSVAMKLAQDGKVLATPTITVRTGTPAQTEFGPIDGNRYRITVDPKSFTSSQGATTAFMRLDVERQSSADSEWKILASPEMTGNAVKGAPIVLQTGFGAKSEKLMQLEVSISPSEATASVVRRSELPTLTPQLRQTCTSCSSGMTLCCTNGCCADAHNGCGQVCD